MGRQQKILLKEEENVMQSHTQIIVHGVEDKATMERRDSSGDGSAENKPTVVPPESSGDGSVEDKATVVSHLPRGSGDDHSVENKATVSRESSSGDDGVENKATLVVPHPRESSGDKAIVVPQLSRESSGDGGLENASMGPRERIKRHRREVAGNVWIPDMWGQETYLNDWIDCTAFDASLVNRNIMLARASLMRQPVSSSSS